MGSGFPRRVSLDSGQRHRKLRDGYGLPYLWAALKRFSAHSVGWFGLLTFGLLAFLILSIWAENTQFGQKLLTPRIAKPPKPSPMTLEEREEIQQLRTFWNLYFGFAVERCTSVFSILLAELELKVYWIDLARPKLIRLKKAGIALSEAVADDSEMNLAHVQERQDEAYAAYLDACRWVAAIAQKEGVDLSNAPTSQDLPRWRDAHRKLKEKLAEQVQRPAQGQLKIVPLHDNDAALRLLSPELFVDTSEIESQAH